MIDAQKKACYIPFKTSLCHSDQFILSFNFVYQTLRGIKENSV